MNKICVLGTVGSGKTTFSEKLSLILPTNHYDLDNLYWSKKLGEKRPSKERNKQLSIICNKGRWIVEGVYVGWIKEAIIKSDKVIILAPPKIILWWRITKRMINKEKSKKYGKQAYAETWKGYCGMLRAINNYYKKGFGGGYEKHLELIKQCDVPYVILRSNKDINAFLNLNKISK